MSGVFLWVFLQKKDLDTEKTLLEQLATPDNLNKAWNLLKKENEDSCGLSGLTIDDFRQNLESNIFQLCEDLKNGSFKFSPYKAAVIKKESGKYRPLQIPEIRDRVVLKAISILLESELATVLLGSADVSFAYQKGKGVREATLKMKSSYKKGHVILKADIINFFEEVQKDKLLNELIYPNLKDDSINELIRKAITPKVGGLNRLGEKLRKLFKNVGGGIPQGNPLSPLLSNLYLTQFDLFVKNSGYSMIRYADDFIVIIKSEKEAKEFYKLVFDYLKQNYSLEIHPLEEDKGKTIIINPEEKEISFLSIKFDGSNIYPSKETVGILKNRIRKLIKDGELNSILYTNIYNEIEKWIAIYSYLDIERYFKNIDSYFKSQLMKKFGKRHNAPKQCQRLANKIRTKQYNKGSNSFWRNVNLLSLLPKFIKKKIN